MTVNPRVRLHSYIGGAIRAWKGPRTKICRDTSLPAPERRRVARATPFDPLGADAGLDEQR
jgi:hypothetical protein